MFEKFQMVLIKVIESFYFGFIHGILFLLYAPEIGLAQAIYQLSLFFAT